MSAPQNTPAPGTEHVKHAAGDLAWARQQVRIAEQQQREARRLMAQKKKDGKAK